MVETAVVAERPSSAGRRLLWWLRDDARAVGDARDLVRRALLLVGLGQDLVDDAVLMVSELTTNAILYGDAPYELVLRIDPAEVVCMVVDHGLHTAPLQDDHERLAWASPTARCERVRVRHHTCNRCAPRY